MVIDDPDYYFSLAGVNQNWASQPTKFVFKRDHTF